MIPLPNIQDIVYYFFKDFTAWISPFWPWIWLLIGIGVFGIVGRGIIDWFNDHLVSSGERKEIKRFFEDDDIVSREEITEKEKKEILDRYFN